MPIPTNLSKYRAGVAKTISLIDKIHHHDDQGVDLFDLDEKEIVISAAVLKNFVLWEEFLEGAFTQYLTGQQSSSGTDIVRYVTPTDLDHAIKIPAGAQVYADWSNHDSVVKLSKLYFENGEPFASNLNSITAILNDLKTIRNASAHISNNTQRKLDALASRVLQIQTSNMSVYAFTLSMHPSSSNLTVLHYYLQFLDISAENISNNLI